MGKNNNNTFYRNDSIKKKRKVVNSVNNTKNNKKKTKNVDSVNSINNPTLIKGLSDCGKNYLMNYILLQKQQPNFISTKSLNQYPSIKAQTSDEIKLLENYENSTVVFDDMLLSKLESIFDLFFTRGRHINIDIYYISKSYFHLPKNTIRKTSIVIILFKQTQRGIILLFHDKAGLDMKLEEWKKTLSLGLRKC